MYVIRIRNTSLDDGKGPNFEYRDEHGVPITHTHTRTLYYSGNRHSLTYGNRLTPALNTDPSRCPTFDSEVEARKAIDLAFHNCTFESLYGLWDVIPLEEAIADYER